MTSPPPCQRHRCWAAAGNNRASHSSSKSSSHVEMNNASRPWTAGAADSRRLFCSFPGSPSDAGRELRQPKGLPRNFSSASAVGSGVCRRHHIALAAHNQAMATAAFWYANVVGLASGYAPSLALAAASFSGSTSHGGSPAPSFSGSVPSVDNFGWAPPLFAEDWLRLNPILAGSAHMGCPDARGDYPELGGPEGARLPTSSSSTATQDRFPHCHPSLVCKGHLNKYHQHQRRQQLSSRGGDNHNSNPSAAPLVLERAQAELLSRPDCRVNLDETQNGARAPRFAKDHLNHQQSLPSSCLRHQGLQRPCPTRERCFNSQLAAAAAALPEAGEAENHSHDDQQTPRRPPTYKKPSPLSTPKPTPQKDSSRTPALPPAPFQPTSSCHLGRASSGKTEYDENHKNSKSGRCKRHGHPVKGKSAFALTKLSEKVYSAEISIDFSGDDDLDTTPKLQDLNEFLQSDGASGDRRTSSTPGEPPLASPTTKASRSATTDAIFAANGSLTTAEHTAERTLSTTHLETDLLEHALFGNDTHAAKGPRRTTLPATKGISGIVTEGDLRFALEGSRDANMSKKMASAIRSLLPSALEASSLKVTAGRLGEEIGHFRRAVWDVMVMSDVEATTAASSSAEGYGGLRGDSCDSVYTEAGDDDHLPRRSSSVENCFMLPEDGSLDDGVFGAEAVVCAASADCKKPSSIGSTGAMHALSLLERELTE